MTTITQHRDRNGDLMECYIAENGRGYPYDQLFDEDGNKLFEFTLVEQSMDEVPAIAAAAAQVDADNNLEALRVERNRRIEETDWWALQDTPTMTADQTAYRQALRDITDTYSSLDDVVWPTKP